MNEYTSTISSLPTGASIYAMDAQSRRVVSEEESVQTEKTLHHLAGRIEELRARLERVLIPAKPVGGANEAKSAAEAASPLTDRLRTFRYLAQNSIDNVEDILNRLDV
jgi:hypothetical protein